MIRIFCDTQGQGIVHSRSWINGHCPAGSQYPLQLKLCIVWYGLVNLKKKHGIGFKFPTLTGKNNGWNPSDSVHKNIDFPVRCRSLPNLSFSHRGFLSESGACWESSRLAKYPGLWKIYEGNRILAICASMGENMFAPSTFSSLPLGDLWMLLVCYSSMLVGVVI